MVHDISEVFLRREMLPKSLLQACQLVTVTVNREVATAKREPYMFEAHPGALDCKSLKLGGEGKREILGASIH